MTNFKEARRAREAPAVDAGAVGPVLLEPNQFERFYRGGGRIDQLRRHSGAGRHRPEDWIASITTTLGHPTDGLSRLPDGRLLRDAIEANPVAFLGREHVHRWGADPALLVKLLDAGERLPVHFHPGWRFARRSLGLRFGKTEAWIIVSAEPDAVLHMGFRAPVDRSTVLRWVQEQDVDAMLAAMHEVPARAGQVVLVPAGTLHAIGAGILLVELQEPSDLSVLLEWRRFGVNSGGEHLGLGWERALAALELGVTAREELLIWDGANSAPGAHELLPDTAAPYFRAQRIVTAGEPADLDASYSILVVLKGSGELWSEHGDRLELTSGATALVPHAAGRATIDGHLTAIRCLPPNAAAGGGAW